jgi:hypothetical protein
MGGIEEQMFEGQTLPVWLLICIALIKWLVQALAEKSSAETPQSPNANDIVAELDRRAVIAQVREELAALGMAVETVRAMLDSREIRVQKALEEISAAIAKLRAKSDESHRDAIAVLEDIRTRVANRASQGEENDRWTQ